MHSYSKPAAGDKNARAGEERLRKIRETANFIPVWFNCIMLYFDAHMFIVATVISCTGKGSRMFKLSVSIPGVEE
jgi:hypothetical protein